MNPNLSRHRRLINWWMTWKDINWPSADIKDDIKRRAEDAARANVTTAILFGAHFRWDWLPYFTQLHDYIAAVAEELHRYDIELFDRHSVNLIHRYDTVEEMRHVMLHSAPHLPLSPSREAAESWTWKGKKLNDWRMKNVQNGQVLYFPQYAGEGFCYRNPDFLEAYCDYAKKLVSDTGIDGLAAEDPVHYLHFSSCGCDHCRAELKRRSGKDLPPIEDTNFWGNWENPAWRHWIDLRFDAGKEFFEKLIPSLPENFIVTTCGANSAGFGATGQATDATHFIEGGSNYVHAEMSGNTPPYFGDNVTVNLPISSRAVTFSHHQAVARTNGIRCFSTGYGFTKPSANIIWAVNKMLDTDCCFSTLKGRLGLPDHILQSLPSEQDVIGDAFTFEKEHSDLFNGEQIAQAGVYFSYKTRNHTFFGSLQNGYYKDYSTTLQTLFKAGISAHTVFEFPSDASQFPVILLASVAKTTQKEKEAMDRYLANGGVILACGPTDVSQCGNPWVLPTNPNLSDPGTFFSTIANGVWHKSAEWVSKTKIDAPCDQADWFEIQKGLFYCPVRVSDGGTEKLLNLCRKFVKPIPLEPLNIEGYLSTIYRTEKGYVLHLLAADYDVDIDHELDEMRFHRSRVNYINRVVPTGITPAVTIRASTKPEVYTPFQKGKSQIKRENDRYTILLPEECSYAIFYFPEE